MNKHSLDGRLNTKLKENRESEIKSYSHFVENKCILLIFSYLFLLKMFLNCG